MQAYTVIRLLHHDENLSYYNIKWVFIAACLFLYEHCVTRTKQSLKSMKQTIWKYNTKISLSAKVLEQTFRVGIRLISARLLDY